jgi:WD40 repeat protein
MVQSMEREKRKGIKGRLLVGWWKRTFGLIAVLGLLMGMIVAQVKPPEQKRFLERRNGREQLFERMKGGRSPNALFRFPTSSFTSRSRQFSEELVWFKPILAPVSVTFSPDGQFLASPIEVNSVGIFRVSDGSLVRTLIGHTSYVNSVSFSPDGSLIASGSSDTTIKIWRVSDGSLLRTLTGHTSYVTSVTFSPDGSLIASGSFDKTIKIWRVTDGTLVRTLTGHTDWVRSVSFSPDGSLIASGSSDYTIKIWRVTDGSLVRTLIGHTNAVRSVSFSPDGSLIASGSSDYTIKIWRVVGGSLVKTLTGHIGGVYSISFSPDGSLIVSGSWDNTIKIWNVSDGSLVRTLTGHTYDVYSVSFSPDGSLIASGGDDATIKIWRVTDGSLVRTLIGHTGEVTSVSFSPDGSLIASGSSDYTIKIWRVTDGSLVRTLIGHTGEVTSVSFSPDGSLIASGSSDYTIKIWRVEDGSLVRTLSHGYVLSVAFSPDSSLLASGGAWDGNINLWKVSDGSLVRTLNSNTDWVGSVVFSPDGNLLASVCGYDDPAEGDDEIKIWKVSDGSLFMTLFELQWTSTIAKVWISFSPDGSLIASGSKNDNNIKIWKVSDGSLIRILIGHTGSVFSGSFSPDGSLIASGGDDGLALWRVGVPTNRSPSVPILLLPSNGATVSPTPTFKVKSEDPDGDQVKFEIEVTKGNETRRFETGFFASGSEATFTVPENQSLSSGQWSWRARAIDNKGAASGWSETRTFIVNRPPLTPVLLSPEDKAFVLSTPTLKVKAEDPEGERVKFILELTQGETMKNFETVSINSGEELTFTVPEKLSAGKWQWRAKAIDTKGAESEWSELRTFVVSTVPSKPVLVSPEEDTIVPTSPTFQLKAEDIDEGQPLKFKIVVVEDISPPSPPRQQGEAKIWVFDQTQNPAGWDKGSYTSGEIATFTVPSDKPLPIGRYRWWAFAFDGLEWSERSEQRRIIVVSEQPPSNINAAVDGYLLDLIDKHANSFYNPKWDITLNQYKAWIAAIAWGAGGKGGYSAHSQTNPSYRGDLFYHVNAGTSFTFSTGLGYFQLDREGGEEGWDRWPSIDKLNPEKSLISVLRWHYGNFRAGATLKDFVGFSLWSSIQSEQIAGIWQQVTGTNWDDHKDKKRWLDWQLVKKSLSQNAANQSFRYENNIINIGKVQWIISEGDDIKTDTGKPVIFNGQYETWLIKARSWQGDTLFEYYYTYDPQAQVEVWAWKNNPKYIFTKEYGSFIEGQFPDGRIPGTNEAGFTLNHDALIFAGERLALQSGPQYSSGDGNLRYFISASPGAGGGQSRQAGTEVLIINPIDTNLDEKTVQFEGVSHPSSLVEQIVDVQKREIRWRFRLSNTGNELVWVQFSIAPKPNLPSGTLIRSKASVIINEQKFETNELITIIDKKAPQINFQALSPIQSKPKFDVQWTVSDDASGVDRVEIWVSDDGSELFLWRVFTAEESKATYIGRFGHEYFFYVVAVDKAGNRSEFPEVAHGWTKVGQPPKIPAGLRIVTLPIISEYSDPKDVFGFEGDKWVWYDPKTGKYVRYPEPPAYILSVGKAFWGQFSQDTFPKAKGEVINDASPFAVTLQKGWNLVGNPWLSDLVWDISSLRVRIGGQEKSLRELKENEGVEPYAWRWDGSNYRLIFDRTIIAGVDNVLPSWEGAWVYAHTDCELILPPPSQGKGRGTRDEGRVAKGNGWSIRLQASVNGSVGEAVLGIANGTRGLAVGLPPEPPTGNNGVQVILLKNNTPLAVDVRSDGSRRQEWEVLVRFGTRDGGRGTSERKEVVLTFDGIGYAPKDVSAWLVDTVTGKRLYLRTQPSYRFVAQEGEVERKFKVVVERGNDRPLRVVGLKATLMRGQGVVIEFSLTKPAKVEAEVLTLTGRRVAVLDAGSSEGLTRRVVWRGVGIEGQKVGSGVYLVRVRAIDEEGREVQSATAVRLR